MYLAAAGSVGIACCAPADTVEFLTVLGGPS
jgi:hypothetical protein